MMLCYLDQTLEKLDLEKMDEIEQLSALPSFPGGSLESKMCSKISELTQVIFVDFLKLFEQAEKTIS